ncbi:hypothetical protein [Yersinia pseudotuberculosis]|uniref:hypothetical protein n=1 Tax=Yersinia pseudotuberculosis TaxID=633 RepID=UPI001A9CBCA0|nr:hypothetical protein [Yersinia pseudotuberculosis]MBO1561836.1 hypothetical protein [Yersinia pseudotuberculosis]
MLSEEQKLQIKMSMNDKWQLVKLTHVWPDGHLINQMAHALIERNAELLSLREQLAALKALEPFCHVFLHPDGPLFNGIVSDSCAGHAGVIPLFTAAKPAED